MACSFIFFIPCSLYISFLGGISILLLSFGLVRIVNNCYIALFGYSAAVIDMFELLLHNTIIDFIWYFVHALKSSYKEGKKNEAIYSLNRFLV